MIISFYTNYVNHHQIPLADEFYKILGEDYHYIAICNTQELIQAMSGYKEIKRPYIIRSYESLIAQKQAYELAVNSDVVIYSTPETLPFVLARYKAKKSGLTFEFGERWFKKGLLNLLSPRLLKNKWVYHIYCPKKTVFKLCASAYASYDESLMQSFKGKCLKWGYFTAVPDINIEDTIKLKRKKSGIKILWVARFLKLKHPEKMIQLALRLKQDQYDFSIDMIGEGPLFNQIKNQITTCGLDGNIRLIGVMPNDLVIKTMREYDIFCFTSDKNEGWGAVLNEAMSAGCCPVVNQNIGSARFLIKDGFNGYMYENDNLDDFVKKVEYLIDNNNKREQMSFEAYKTMKDEWNPKEAAVRLIEFCRNYDANNITFYKSGPMSIAEIYKG